MNGSEKTTTCHLKDGRPFLTGWCGSDADWTRFSKLFLTAEHVAMSFAGSSSWVPIRNVCIGQDNRWAPSGVIEIVVSPGDWGVLFHEIFHSAFHNSPLHAGEDEQWGDAFCDAFRYVMEEAHLTDQPSNWLSKHRRYAELKANAILAQSHDLVHDRKYALPASMIIRHARCVDTFRLLWNELTARRSQRQQDVCEQQFGFRIE